MPITSRLAIAILLMLLSAMSAAAEEKLTFGYIGDKLSFGSLVVLKEAYSRLGITVETVQLPAARALAEADRGITDGEVHRIKDIEILHPELIRVDFPLNNLEGVALAIENLQIATPDDLIPYRVGIKTGLVYSEKLTQKVPNVTRLPDSQKLITPLLQGRLDVIITDSMWAELQIAQNPGKGLHIVGQPLVVIPLYHFVHKRHAELVPKLVDILKTMEQSGLSERLRKEAYKEYELKGTI